MVVAVLVLLVPVGAMAERPKIKPHHKVPVKWKKIVAAKRVVAVDTGGASTTFSLTSFGALNAAGFGLVKTGVGTMNLSGSPGLTTGGTLIAAGTLNLGTSGFAANNSYGGSIIVNGNAIQAVVPNVTLGTNTILGTVLSGGNTGTATLDATLINPTGVVGLSPNVTSGLLTVIDGGNVSGVTASLVKTGAGTLALSSGSGFSPAPEPSSALLVLLGAGILSQRRRRP